MILRYLNDDMPKVVQPDGFKGVTLFPHQLTLLYQCHKLEKDKYIEKKYNYDTSTGSNLFEPTLEFAHKLRIKTDFGIICDKVGSGKSYVILGLILMEKFLKTKYILPFNVYNSNNLQVIVENDNYLPINLLFVPHTIFNQWIRYIKRDTNLKVYVIKTKRDFKEDPYFYKDYDIIITTPSKHYVLQDLFAPFILSRVIYDEVDSLKISKCYKINASFHWYVSSSIDNLLHPSGIWRIANFNENTSGAAGRYKYIKTEGIIRSKYINKLFCELKEFPFRFKNRLFLLNNTSYIDSSLKIIPYTDEIIVCDNPYEVNILDGFLTENTMAMIRAGDIKSVVSRLDCHVGKEENLIQIICRKTFRELKNEKVKYEATEKMEYDSEEEKKLNLNLIKKKINELEIKINLINKRIKEATECPICFDKPDNKTIVNCCKNIFCLKCISKHIETIGYLKCPLCRSTDIKLNELVISHENDIEKEVKIKKTKELAIKQILENNKDKKILIFSEYSNSFNKISKVLNEVKLDYDIIKGSHFSIKKKLNKFKDGKLPVLLLNSKHQGSGINLENTDIIILYHKMSRDMRRQVIGRAQRIGRKTPLKIYKIRYECEQAD